MSPCLAVSDSPREAVAATTTYEQACTIATRLSGQAISRQAFGLFRKIRELDDHVRDPGSSKYIPRQAP